MTINIMTINKMTINKMKFNRLKISKITINRISINKMIINRIKIIKMIIKINISTNHLYNNNIMMQVYKVQLKYKVKKCRINSKQLLNNVML